MLKKIFVIIFVILFFATAAHSMKVGDVVIADTFMAENTRLILNGAGFRTKMFIKGYACGLYLPFKNKDIDSIINSNQPMAIKMHIVTSLITGDRMVTAINEGFSKACKGNTNHIQGKIDRILSVFQEEIQVGDVYDIVYTPGKGTTISKNGVSRAVIAGFDFKKALFGIWLCDQPADKKLKKQLLGL